MCVAHLGCCFKVTANYISRCQKAKLAPNSSLLEFLNTFQPDLPPSVCDLSSSHVTVDAVAVIAQMLTDVSQQAIPISSLRLVQSQFTDLEFSLLIPAVAKSHTLLSLNLSRNRLTPSMVTTLTQAFACTTLESLILDDTGLGDKGVQTLCAALPNSRIKWLSLAKCGITAAGVSSLVDYVLRDNNEVGGRVVKNRAR